MAWCLIKQKADAFLKALKSGEIDPAKLEHMSPDVRHDFLAKYVGKENAQNVNALFESKLLLKNKQAGYISWAKRVGGMSATVKQDLFSKIERMDKVLVPGDEDVFLKDLAETRLGLGVTRDEALTVFDLSSKASEAKTAWEDKLKSSPANWKKDSSRLKYGLAQVELEKYVNELKLQSQHINPLRHPIKTVLKAPGAALGTLKSLVSTLDNSYFGRQGIKTLLDLRTSGIWMRGFLKSWRDIGRELIGHDVMDLIKADIYSRPNALNGKYKAGKYGLDVLSEEAFPSTLPEKIPVLRRLYKASEAAYNGGALRMRADLADRLIARADKNGVNTLDPEEAEGLGHLVGSMTGRGSLGKGEALAKDINVVLFSGKFLKANIDTLTAHAFDGKASSFVKKEAAKNLVSMAVTVGVVTALASYLMPGSTDPDPRSPNFGKIKIGGHWTDITGGMGSFITLASRLVPTMHNGQWGLWDKSKTGTFTDLGAGKYGQQTGLDILNNFIEGKLSPGLGIIRDIWAGKNYQGQPPTFSNEIQNQQPMVLQNIEQAMKDPLKAGDIGALIMDGLGFSVNFNPPVQPKDWNVNTSTPVKEFQQNVSADDFKQANQEYNDTLNQSMQRLQNSQEYKDMNDSDKQTIETKLKDSVQKQVFSDYGFTYHATKDPTKTQENKDLINSVVNP